MNHLALIFTISATVFSLRVRRSNTTVGFDDRTSASSDNANPNTSYTAHPVHRWRLAVQRGVHGQATGQQAGAYRLGRLVQERSLSRSDTDYLSS